MTKRSLQLWLLALGFGGALPATAQGTGCLDVAWTVPTLNTDGTALAPADLTGYRLYYGTAPPPAQVQAVAGGATTAARICGLADGFYYLQATALTATEESDRTTMATVRLGQVAPPPVPPPTPPPVPPPACVPNLATGRPTTVTSIDGDYGRGVYATDCDPTTRWAADRAQATAVLQVDLGQRFALTRVRIAWEVACGKAYTIDASDDAVTWQPLATVTNNAALVNDLPVAGAGRYVRLNGQEKCTGYGYSVWEFEVYGTAATPPAPPAPPARGELCLVDGIAAGTRPLYAPSASGTRGAKVGDLPVGPASQPAGTANPVRAPECSCTDLKTWSGTVYSKVGLGYVAGCKSYGVR